MIKAIFLVFAPVKAWDGIIQAKRSTFFVFGAFLLPLLFFTCAVEGWGLMNLGERQASLRKFIKLFPLEETIGYEAANMVLTVAVIFVSATIIKSLGETFHGRHTYSQAFKTAVYGLSPLLALRVLDVFIISPWIAWGIGIVFSAAVLYHGVPRVMEPDPSHAFGLYLTSILLLTIITGLLRYVTAGYLEGKFRPMGVTAMDFNWSLFFT